MLYIRHAECEYQIGSNSLTSKQKHKYKGFNLHVFPMADRNYSSVYDEQINPFVNWLRLEKAWSVIIPQNI